MNARDPDCRDVIMPYRGFIHHGDDPYFYYDGFVFYCPGCESVHSFITRYDDPKPPDPRDASKYPLWTFNGDLVKPTFAPSLLYPRLQIEGKTVCCHSFVINGEIRYERDSTHALAGKTVPLSRDNFLFK